jgi:hypothetical protein
MVDHSAGQTEIAGSPRRREPLAAAHRLHAVRGGFDLEPRLSATDARMSRSYMPQERAGVLSACDRRVRTGNCQINKSVVGDRQVALEVGVGGVEPGQPLTGSCPGS